MADNLTTDEAINLLKNAVKYSCIDNQKHLDFSLVTANKLDDYQRAMVVVNIAVENGELTKDELNNKIGLT